MKPAKESAAEENDKPVDAATTAEATSKKENDHSNERSGHGGGENSNHTLEQPIGDAEPKNTIKQSGAVRNSQVVLKSDFMRVVRIYYKVVKEIVLSDNLLIEQSKQIRRMDIGEVMEVFQGPMLDPSVGVYRIHGRALKDGIVGWVTVAGNQGITFLLPGGNVFKVVKPVEFTEDVKETEGQGKVRMLKEGEILEVMEWARTSSSALGVTRVRAKAQDDGAVGWATTADSSAAVYLEAT